MQSLREVAEHLLSVADELDSLAHAPVGADCGLSEAVQRIGELVASDRKERKIMLQIRVPLRGAVEVVWGVKERHSYSDPDKPTLSAAINAALAAAVPEPAEPLQAAQEALVSTEPEF
jgi:hypothetical protein